MTLAQVEKIYIEQLQVLYDADEARSLAYYAIGHSCGLLKSQILINKNKELSLQDETSLQHLLDELKTGRPIQYVIGETEFYGCRIKVNSSVLIPRPETEELAAWIIEEVKSDLRQAQDDKQKAESEEVKILDIGTGSGCIPIALKKHLPDAEVYGLDISAEALETALKNAVLNETEVKFLQGDILDPDLGFPSGPFDIIVSNPPYITESEKKDMHSNVLAFEPEGALFVPDADPMRFYRHIAFFAKTYLKKNGLLFFELNEHFAAELWQLLSANGFSKIEIKKDLMGKDRMSKASKDF